MQRDYRARSDALPENNEYRDTGCEVAPACLRCPLEVCRYDVAAGIQRGLDALAADRRDAVLRMRRQGIPARQIAETLGVSRRTVNRILREGGRNEHSNR